MANMLKVSLALSDKMQARLDTVKRKLGFKDSDVVGVALQVYLHLQEAENKGYRTYLRGPGGEVEVNLGKRTNVPAGVKLTRPNIQSLSQARQDRLNEGLGTEEPRTFEIWAEGYSATGDSGRAHKVGEAMGRTFREAVLAWFSAHPDPVNFDPNGLRFWSCRLFPAEAEARQAFG
jgi:hypothetical protein